MKNKKSDKNINELIVKFMGSNYINSPYKANKEDLELTDFWHWTKPTLGYPRCKVTGIEWSTAIQIGNFKYTTSLDWIMPVVKEIDSIIFGLLVSEKLGGKQNAEKLHGIITKHNMAFHKGRLLTSPLIEEIIPFVTEFIEYYNKIKK